jgi:hypothetical protein
MICRTLFIAVFIALPALGAAAPERLQLDKTTILGNRELPKVTFVVPWADAAAEMPAWTPEPTARPDAVPLDQESYRRRQDYLRQQQGAAGNGTP